MWTKLPHFSLPICSAPWNSSGRVVMTDSITHSHSHTLLIMRILVVNALESTSKCNRNFYVWLQLLLIFLRHANYRMEHFWMLKRQSRISQAWRLCSHCTSLVLYSFKIEKQRKDIGKHCNDCICFTRPSWHSLMHWDHGWVQGFTSDHWL